MREDEVIEAVADWLRRKYPSKKVKYHKRCILNALSSHW